jgi:hypothetical protein
VTFGQYLAGLAGLSLIVGASGLAALRVRRALLPCWSKAPARLAEIVIALALILLVAEILGAIGSFHRLPLLAGVTMVSVLAAVAAPRLAAVAGAVPAVAGGDAGGLARKAAVAHDPRFVAVALAIAFLALVLWLARSLDAYESGVFDVDSVQYHLPFAARFVQTGSLTQLHFVSPDPVHAFHPLNSESLHAIGMVLFRTDVLSPALNVGWIIVALLAAWVAGCRSGLSPLILAGTGVVALLPLLLKTQAGAANSDTAALALLLAAVALLLHGVDEPPATYIAAAAAGLAIGTKLTVLVPVGVLTLLLLIRWRSRPRLALGWCGVLAATGGFWYLRNLIRTGSPLPSLDLKIGPLGFPSPDLQVVDRTGFAIVDYAFDGEVWESVFLPGLVDAFSTTTLPLLGLLGAGIVLGLAGRGPEARLVAAVALAGIVAYLATPLSAPGPEGDPDQLLFALNLRYVLPVFPLALVALALSARKAPSEVQWALLGVFAVTALLAWRHGTEIPVRGAQSQPEALPIVAGALLAVLAVVWARRRSIVLFAGVLVLLGALLVGGGWRFERRYLELRHRQIAPPDLLSWLAPQHDRRIGISGYYNHYLLMGAGLDNDVREIGFPRAHGGFERPKNCRSFRRLVNDSGYEFIVIGNAFYRRPRPAMLRWARSDRSITPIVERPSDGLPIWVLGVDGRLDPDRCRPDDAPGTGRSHETMLRQRWQLSVALPQALHGGSAAPSGISR